jgi:hypothetical protein
MIRLEGAHFAFGGGKPILEGVDLPWPEGARASDCSAGTEPANDAFPPQSKGSSRWTRARWNVPKGRRIVYLPQHPTAPAGDTILRNVLESHPTLHDLEDQILRVEAKMAEAEDPGRLDRLVERPSRAGAGFRTAGRLRPRSSCHVDPARPRLRARGPARAKSHRSAPASAIVSLSRGYCSPRGPPTSRRAHQPPRFRDGGMARRLFDRVAGRPSGVPRHGAGGLARPLVSSIGS